MSDWVKLSVNRQQRKRGVIWRRWIPATGETQEMRVWGWPFWRDARRSWKKQPKPAQGQV